MTGLSFTMGIFSARRTDSKLVDCDTSFSNTPSAKTALVFLSAPLPLVIWCWMREVEVFDITSLAFNNTELLMEINLPF